MFSIHFVSLFSARFIQTTVVYFSLVIWLIFKAFFGVLLGNFWTYFDRFLIFLYFSVIFLTFFWLFWVHLEPLFGLLHFFKLPKIARKMSKIFPKWPKCAYSPTMLHSIPISDAPFSSKYDTFSLVHFYLVQYNFLLLHWHVQNAPYINWKRSICIHGQASGTLVH